MAEREEMKKAMDLDEAGREWRMALLQSKMAASEARLARQTVSLLFAQAEDRRMVEEAILNRVFGVTR